jgi:hypothetical protein
LEFKEFWFEVEITFQIGDLLTDSHVDSSDTNCGPKGFIKIESLSR